VVDLALRAGPYGVLRDPLGRRLSLAKLESMPHGIDLGPLRSCLPGRLHTPDRRIRLAPEALLGDVPRLEGRLERPPVRDGRLVLIGRRQIRSNNSWMHNSARLVRGKPRCVLLMHPDDARSRGVEDGARVSVTSRVGRVEVPVALDPDVMPGVVSLPHGWGHRAKGARLSVANAVESASANDLVDELHYDALTGTAGLNGVPVTVEPLRG
jgi:anaerobic selenocysteine-containing dehydrogenase